MKEIKFEKAIISEVKNDIPPGAMNTFSTAGDINGDGLIDVVVGGRNGRLVWLENKGIGRKWEVHLIDEVEKMECGGSLYDITGNGCLDLVNGGDWRSDEVCWWENPGTGTGKWKKRVIAKTGCNQFHDTVFGEIKNDGKVYLAFTNQGGDEGTQVFCVPVPDEPSISPWPGLECIAKGITQPVPPWERNKKGLQPEEGLVIGDIDGDGKNELVCGTHWFKYKDGKWEGYRFASGYICTKIAIGDVDGDGRNEIILSEGDPCIYNRPEGGKLAWFKPKQDITQLWEEHLVDDFLLDAHSLGVGNICGAGKMDIFVGEIGVADENRNYIGRLPQLYIYENDGKGNFSKHIIDSGTGIHDAVLVDLRNTGKLDIVGKPLHGDQRWKVIAWYNHCSAE